MATEFNEQLKGKIIQLKHELTEASLTYVDVYAAKYGLISNPMKEGNGYQLNIVKNFSSILEINYVRIKIDSTIQSSSLYFRCKSFKSLVGFFGLSVSCFIKVSYDRNRGT